jgi:signal transduction histidine kinase
VTQSLGGRLSLESAPDRGTSIYIILPLAAPQQQAAVAPLPVTNQADG